MSKLRCQDNAAEQDALSALPRLCLNLPLGKAEFSQVAFEIPGDAIQSMRLTYNIELYASGLRFRNGLDLLLILAGFVVPSERAWDKRHFS